MWPVIMGLGLLIVIVGAATHQSPRGVWHDGPKPPDNAGPRRFVFVGLVVMAIGAIGWIAAAAPTEVPSNGQPIAKTASK